MDNNHDRTKEVLNNMDQEAEDIKETVQKSQKQLLKTLDEIIKECDVTSKLKK